MCQAYSSGESRSQIRIWTHREIDDTQSRERNPVSMNEALLDASEPGEIGWNARMNESSSSSLITVALFEPFLSTYVLYSLVVQYSTVLVLSTRVASNKVLVVRS
jgi:hypothetical protein